ncbi:MAG: hypothetical protein ABUT39_11895 [Acidobacteriota bacterium]
MARRLSAFLLLALAGLGLFLGPHPCATRQTGPEPAGMSCHAAGHSAAGERVRAAAPDDREDCGSRFCQHACHATALAEAGPASFSIAPVSDATVEPSGPGLPLFAAPIDHIPLA